jgi:hypothetical protein
LGASASASTSTYCPRQWAIQVRRSARPATSTQRSGPSRTGLRSNRGRWGQETTDRADATGTIAFGRLSPGTAREENSADNQSGRPGRRPAFVNSFSRAHFAQPQAGPRWATQPPVLLHGEGLCSETSRGASKRRCPLPRPILLRRVFLSHEKGRCFFGGSPLHLTSLAPLHRLSK